MATQLQSFQALRAFACVAVAWGHMAHFPENFGIKFAAFEVARWFLNPAVDLLFVMSGFIMAHITLGQFGRPSRVPNFLLRRFWRVYPCYWASMLLSLAGAAIIGWNVLGPDVSEHWWRWFALLPDRSPNTLNRPAWTLVYEIQFYAIFSIALLFPARFAAVLLGGVAVLVVVGAGLHQSSTVWEDHLLSPFVLEFLSGAAAAQIIGSGRHRLGFEAVVLGSAALAVTTLGASLVIPWGEYSYLVGQPWIRVAMFGPASVLIMYGAAAMEFDRRLLVPTWLLRVGDTSFSIYLIHMPVQMFMIGLWMLLPEPRPRASWWLPLTFAASIVFCWWFHLAVERPTLNWAKNGRRAIRVDAETRQNAPETQATPRRAA
jgi:peptidoglycan/LPS O-acetylase OafA/YrhL